MTTAKIKNPILGAALISCFLCFSPVHAQCQIDALDHESAAVAAFKAKLKVSGLEPKHPYQLTINGYKNHPSNDILKTYNDYEGEGYIDFKKVSTDAGGMLNTEIDRKLPKGEYRVKFFIKDPDKNWLVVCSEDLVEFEVK